MSWIQDLYETYENCQGMIGVNAGEDVVPLLPICHTTQKAQVEIIIDNDGNFKRAKVIPKSDSRTIVPCTEASGGRSGVKPECHPLCDKLQYIAGDFVQYGGDVTRGYASNPREPFEKYHELLKKWCESEFAHPKAKSILKYIEKETAIKDLTGCKVLWVDSNNKLIKNRSSNKKKGDESGLDIFDLLPGKENKKTGVIENWQANAFVRWAVETPNDVNPAVYTDSSLFDSWIKYYESTKGEGAFCQITGKYVPLADQHPAKIRNDGDKAKLISSNDKKGFTFRGRFKTANQACSVGFEVTQKAHNTLRWLIGRQGYKRGEQAIVAWSINGNEIPDPMADTFSLIGLDSLESDSGQIVWTAQEFALRLNKRIAGYSLDIGDTTNIVVIGLDSSTPGRMSLPLYRKLTGSEFIERINNWHTKCSWIHDYRQKEVIDKNTGKAKKIYTRFVGAPAPDDIIEAAYGSKVDDKLRKSVIMRILPCIIDGQKIPRDIVESVVRRATNRIGMENWEWNKTLSIACALYRKFHEEEDYDMSLDESRKTRDYLYGRLLALADNLEQWALNESDEKRPTSAARFMQRFADHPYSTWRNIELMLVPYKMRLGKKKTYKIEKLITEVMAMFKPEDFVSDRRLSGEFLLGYHCQRESLLKNDRKDTAKESASE